MKWEEYVHRSDCARHNAPAERAGKCDCGVNARLISGLLCAGFKVEEIGINIGNVWIDLGEEEGIEIVATHNGFEIYEIPPFGGAGSLEATCRTVAEVCEVVQEPSE